MARLPTHATAICSLTMTCRTRCRSTSRRVAGASSRGPSSSLRWRVYSSTTEMSGPPPVPWRSSLVAKTPMRQMACAASSEPPLPAAVHVPLHPPPFQKAYALAQRHILWARDRREPPPLGCRRAAFDRPGPELSNECWPAAAPGEVATSGVAPGDSLPGKTQNGSRRKGPPPTGGRPCTLQ